MKKRKPVALSHSFRGIIPSNDANSTRNDLFNSIHLVIDGVELDGRAAGGGTNEKKRRT